MAKSSSGAKSAKNIKLNESQSAVAGILVNATEYGLNSNNWEGGGKFPTRTFQSLEKIGLAKPKEKKVEGSKKKETFWFPTVKLAKVVGSAHA